jgi:hypothetical protein
MAQIVGSAVLDAFQAIKTRGGEQQLNKILECLDAESKSAFSAPVEPWKWYPLDAFVSFLETDIRETAGGDRSVLIERSKKVIESQLHGVKRFFVQMGSPKYVINRIASVHESYFREIQIIPEVEDGPRAVIKYIGFAKHHDIMECAIIGFYLKALEICGAKDVTAVFTVPMAQGTAFSELTISWT